MLKKIAENRVSLLESSMEDINRFHPTQEFYQGDEDDLLYHWELAYEIEYKLARLKMNDFTGVEKRRENIIKILEKKLSEIIVPIAGTLLQTFNVWLSSHAITKPKQWAEARYYDNSGGNMVDIFGINDSFVVILDELKRYHTGIYSISDLIMKTVEENPNVLDRDFLSLVVQDEYNMIIDNLEYEGIEEFNDRYSDYLGKEFKDEDEAREFLDDNVSAFDKDYFKIHGGEKEALEYVINELEQTMFFKEIERVKDALDIDEFFLTAYEKIVFPAWYEYWKSQGIDQTRKTIEKIAKDLSKVKSMPVDKQFMMLNIAKDASHQNGSMMEYYSEEFGIDYYMMERLSDMDTTNWDDELREIGVNI